MKRKIVWIVIIVFLLFNIIAYIQAYKFTHFSLNGAERTVTPDQLGSFDKAKLLFTGISNPKPRNKSIPKLPYQTIQIKSDVLLEGWWIKRANSTGTIILFHGYTGEKSLLLERAEIFLENGYSVLLMDFIGSGGSEGSETHLGYTESCEVKDCFEFIRSTGEKNIHLFGTSMGAAAILKAISDHHIEPASIILECPFGSLYDTVSARFRMMGIPSFPTAAALTFWGGIQLGFWGFDHNPTEYARAVETPSLILFGELDDRVSIEETYEIQNNLHGAKKLITYSDQGHDVFTENKTKWRNDVALFMKSLH